METLKKLKIVITLQFCHPEFSGTRTQTFEYSFANAIQAEIKYLKLLSHTSDYDHVWINIVEEMLEN